MQHVPTLELLKRAVRYAACTHCHKRPRASFSHNAARPCEVECTIFANLAKLAKIAHDDAGNRCAPMERQMREQICLNCHAHASAGNDCEQRVNRECPLSIHLLEVIEPIERILKRRATPIRRPAGALKGT